MPIDISDIKYELELLTEDGIVHNLTETLVSLSWEEQAGELAQRANITLQNINIGDSYLMGVTKLNCPIFVYVNCDGNRYLVFKGNIWNFDYSSSDSRKITLTAYDPLIRLQKSKDFKYYEAGMSTKLIIEDICSNWEIPVNFSFENIRHEKTIFKARTISDMIISILDEVTAKTSKKYIISYKDDCVNIDYRGMNEDVYRFETNNVISVNNKLSMDNLVTAVKIIGQENKKGYAPIEDTVLGAVEFGVLQEIIMRDSAKTLGDARNEARIVLKERGQPSETIQVAAPDLPLIRKGDMVKIAAGNLDGYFYVIGITHNATSRTMAMELEKPDAPITNLNPIDRSNIKK